MNSLVYELALPTQCKLNDGDDMAYLPPYPQCCEGPSIQLAPSNSSLHGCTSSPYLLPGCLQPPGFQTFLWSLHL